MDTTTENHFSTQVVTRVAGEDIRPGDFVTVLNEMIELPSFLWGCSAGIVSAEEPIRSVYKPQDAGNPSKVVAVCLPFVYVKRAFGGIRVFDTRRHQLVRLDRQTGRMVWKRLRVKRKKKRK
ncbi:hypothetical protein [Rhodopirellula sp. MGV]|uniref:hypothetical protein n=1 Tax=Rhodopirellula sp. MGV TaxID=2023130 RepID=UPI000B95D43F|nr:hypothetical protein [Rhodopirellula sp. MGV]OYP34162.1 hypothetical protein CGZ80_16025 [Rhodopirellula sp. MGV]PNY33598.1 hypothetical protein C2E31_27750 [Rhodopirellula baltica]